MLYGDNAFMTFGAQPKINLLHSSRKCPKEILTQWHDSIQTTLVLKTVSRKIIMTDQKSWELIIRACYCSYTSTP